MSQVIHQYLFIINFKILSWYDASATRILNYFSHVASTSVFSLLLFLKRILAGLEQIWPHCFLARKWNSKEQYNLQARERINVFPSPSWMTTLISSWFCTLVPCSCTLAGFSTMLNASATSVKSIVYFSILHAYCLSFHIYWAPAPCCIIDKLFENRLEMDFEVHQNIVEVLFHQGSSQI